MIELPDGVNAKQLSERIGVSSSDLVQSLFNMGEMVNINQPLNREPIEFLSMNTVLNIISSVLKKKLTRYMMI
ncbi:MAG: translation initiation factor IF-2 N-terminal domain-containing protein [Actinomycetota bacterium]|nr:translation initiation factor IF-2 N-terminal domain-containing protein [Actinomycetota bacterium]